MAAGFGGLILCFLVVLLVSWPVADLVRKKEEEGKGGKEGRLRHSWRQITDLIMALYFSVRIVVGRAAYYNLSFAFFALRHHLLGEIVT